MKIRKLGAILAIAAALPLGALADDTSTVDTTNDNDQQGQSIAEYFRSLDPQISDEVISCLEENSTDALALPELNLRLCELALK